MPDAEGSFGGSLAGIGRSPEGVATVNAIHHEYSDRAKIQCPKCGNDLEIQLHTNTGYALEYMSICQFQTATSGRCGAVLTLQVTSHSFPTKPEA